MSKSANKSIVKSRGKETELTDGSSWDKSRDDQVCEKSNLPQSPVRHELTLEERWGYPKFVADMKYLLKKSPLSGPDLKHVETLIKTNQNATMCLLEKSTPSLLIKTKQIPHLMNFKTLDMFTGGSFPRWEAVMQRVNSVVDNDLFKLQHITSLDAAPLVFLSYLDSKLDCQHQTGKKELFLKVELKNQLETVTDRIKSDIALVQVVEESCYRIYVQGQLFMKRCDPVQATFALIQAFNLFQLNPKWWVYRYDLSTSRKQK